jgi:glycerate kinase
MKIIIAPNSFKGSLDAFKVAQAIEKGMKKSRLSVECELFPIADGGDHTLEVFHNWLGGEIRKSSVAGPLGEPVDAEWVMVANEKTAIVEMAKASGISLIAQGALDPMKANSYGTGQLIVEAVRNGAEKIVLGLGGSATVDGGLGILQAFGGELFDAHGNLIGTDTNAIMELHSISIDKIDHHIAAVEFVILCDVENPLLGMNGAAHIFGPQKGADPEKVEILEESLQRFNEIVKNMTGKDFSDMNGAGAAGGIAVMLGAFFNSTLAGGVDFLLEKMQLEESLQDADLLITAEGKVDGQTLSGKGPFGVAEMARKYRVPSVILAGKADEVEELNKGFTAVFPITNGPMSLETAMSRTALDLEQTAKQIGNLIAMALK